MSRAEVATRRFHRALARRVSDRERDIDAVVEQMYGAVRGLPPEQVVEVMRAAGTQFAEQLTETYREALREAARLGAEASHSGLVAALGPARVPPPSGWESAARWVERRGPDGLTLSSRVHRQTVAYRAELDRVLARGLREGVSSSELVRRLVDESFIKSEPIAPQAVRRLATAVRRMGRGAGDAGYAAASRAAEHVEGIIDRLVQLPRARHGMRPATEHLAETVTRAIDAGRRDVAANAIRWWARDRMRYQQHVVARTEMQRAYSRAFEEHASEVPGVVGLTWVSARDSFVCEVCQERHGQTYPLGDHPDMPAHPQCRCRWIHAIDRKLALRAAVDRALAAA